MIVYADSSVLVRAYLPNEAGHDKARSLLEDPELVVVSGTWTRVEVTGALVRAARVHRGQPQKLVAAWETDIGPDGAITLLTARQRDIERHALEIVKGDGLRAMDAWHVACAALTVIELADGETCGFATRDQAQAEVAARFGFMTL